MKKLAVIFFLLISKNSLGQVIQNTAKSATEFVPAGYVVVEKIKGDLNKDNHADYVFVIKATNKDKVVTDQYRGELDRNRRGLIIAFKNTNHYELVLENRNCFSSENEDGGVYFAPELSVSINKGKLQIHYAHGRYGYWAYSFRYQNSDFELIGYDSSQNHGPIVERLTSINFATKKMVTKENTNQNAEGGDEKFKEIWGKITFSKLIKLKEIADFDEFNVESLISTAK